MTIYILSILILLMISAMFSSMETAFTSVNKIKIKNMASDDVPHASLALRLIDNYDKILSTILIGNNIANIAMTSIATVFFVELCGSMGATVATIVITILVLIFGEITPKNIAKQKAEKFALVMAPVLNVLYYIFLPFNWIFSKWKDFICFVFKLNDTASYSEDELITIVEEATTEGSIGEDQGELITNAIAFDELEAIDIITPRVEVVAFDIKSTRDEIGKLFKETGLSRLPVYREDLDDIVGVLNQKDFHNYVIGEGKEVIDYVKPVVYVGESIKAAVLLKKMQSKKTHMAIIIDEYGGTSGIVTLEDIIEELVGEIYDEHDVVEMKEVTELYNGSYSVAGSANVEKFFEMFDEEADFNCTTVNGWVMIALDRLPQAGDEFVYMAKHKRFIVKVTQADERKALMTNIRVEDIEEDDD